MSSADPDLEELRKLVTDTMLAPDFRRKLPPGDDIRDRMLRDSDWNSLAFLDRYGELLGSNYLAEIFCTMAYVATDFYHTEVASAPLQHFVFTFPEVHLVTLALLLVIGRYTGYRLSEWARFRAFRAGATP